MRSANPLGLLALAFLGLGCPQSQAGSSTTSAPTNDATTASSSSTSGTSSSGTGSVGSTTTLASSSGTSPPASSSSTSSGSAATTTTTGSSSSGSSNVLVWGETAVPTNLTAADAIWGTSVTDFYVGDSDGALFHFNGSGYGQGFQDPANAGITSVYESPTGKVYVAGSELYSCSSQCTTNTNFAAPANYGTLGCTVTAVCGYEETVYGVGNEGNGPDGPVGCLLSTDGQGNWTSLTLSALAGGANSCAVAPSGTTFIGGAGGIINYSPLNGATAEVINWPAGTNGSNVYVTFAAMWTDGTNAFAAGGTRRIFQRTSAGWNLILNNSPIDPNTDGNSDASFAAMAGAGGDVYAFGDDMSTHQAAYYDGQTLAWTYLPSSIEPNTFLWAAWAADANNYFVVGSHDGNDAAIFHGHH